MIGTLRNVRRLGNHLFAQRTALSLGTALLFFSCIPAANAQTFDILNGLRILTNTINNTRSLQKASPNPNPEMNRESAGNNPEQQQQRIESYRSWYQGLSQEAKEIASWLVFKASLGDFPSLKTITSSEWFQQKSLQQKQHTILLYRESATHIQASAADADSFFKNAYCIHSSGSSCSLVASSASNPATPLAMKSANPPWEQPLAPVKQKTSSKPAAGQTLKQPSSVSRSDSGWIPVKGIDFQELKRSAETYRRSNRWDGRIRSNGSGANQTGSNCAHYRAQMSAYQAQQRYRDNMAGELAATTGGYWSDRGSAPVMPPGCR